MSPRWPVGLLLSVGWALCALVVGVFNADALGLGTPSILLALGALMLSWGLLAGLAMVLAPEVDTGRGMVAAAALGLAWLGVGWLAPRVGLELLDPLLSVAGLLAAPLLALVPGVVVIRRDRGLELAAVATLVFVWSAALMMATDPTLLEAVIFGETSPAALPQWPGLAVLVAMAGLGAFLLSTLRLALRELRGLWTPPRPP